jgi:PAS domain S-box-containing protein
MNVATNVSKIKLRNLLLSLWLPLTVLLVGYGLASHYAAEQQLQQNQRIHQAVVQRLSQIAKGVTEKVTLYQYGLRATRSTAMALTPERFTYQDMQTYTLSRNFDIEFPGARGFGLIRYIKAEEKEAFVARMAAERPDNFFKIKQLQPHTDSLFIIQYIEPEQRNYEAVGLDIGSENMRRQAALDAALNADVRLTGPITLVQELDKTQHGFLILLPVYLHQPTPEDPQQRLAQLYGWSYAPILIGEVLSTVSGLQNDVQLTISDVTEQPAKMFFHKGDTDASTDIYRQQQTLSLFGRQWQLALTPTQVFITDLQLSANNVLFSQMMSLTLLLTLGVFLIQLLVMRRHQQAKHEAELGRIKQSMLKQANAELEHQVAIRAAEISHVNMLQRSILEGAGYAIIATDVDGLITAFNPAAERLLGYKATEVVQQQTPAIFHVPAEVERHAAKLSVELGVAVEVGFATFVAKAHSGQQDANRWTYITKTGQHIPVKLIVSALTDETGNLAGFLGIAFDLTEQLAHDAELAKAKEQAEIASKAKSDFLANMSHEIRTPMNAILGLLQLVANTTLDNRQADYIEKTQRAAMSLLTLLNDILDFSKVEAGKLELDPHPFSLPTLMQDIGIILSSGLEDKEIEVLFRIAPDVPQQLVGDSVRIQQVLLNLAGNAIKFTSQGEVVIAITVAENNTDNLRLQFNVRDTGIGMTAEQQKAIFTGFHQAESSISRRFGGTGLGLAISKRLINLMQGHINVKSQAGQGSDFQFDIVLQHGAKDCAAEHNANAAIPSDLKILIVDDNANARIILQEMATSFGWQADVASSAEQAITLLEQAQTTASPYTIVFVDWRMPDMDGLAFAEHVRQGTAASTTPLVVMVTAYGKEMLTKHADSHQQLLDAFLIKPVTHDMMLKTVKDILSASSPADSEPKRAIASKPLSGLTLLLVEDNLTNQLVAAELLKTQGASIDVASSGEQALALLARQSNGYDLVLMDIQMPHMDGYETTRRIRQQATFSNLPIVAMTANVLPTDKAACLAAGMNDHIAKPFSLDDVVAKVLHYCQVPTTEPVAAKYRFADKTTLAFCQQHGVQLELAYARLGESVELYVKVLHQFIQDLTSAPVTLQQEAVTPAAMKLLFHSLKGAAGTVGFTALANMASQQETALNDDKQNSTTDIKVVLGSIAKAKDTALQLLSMLDTAPQQATRIATVAEPELQPQLHQLLNYLSSANMAAVPLFQQLYSQILRIDPQLAAQMNSAVSALDFAAATAILRSLMTEGAK